MPTPKLDIASFSLSDWMTNCYVLSAQDSKGCWIIDAGFEPEPLIEHVKRNELEPQQVILTHGHVDHIAGVSALRAFWPGVPILIHEAEEAFLADPMLNLSAALGGSVVAPDATATLTAGQELDLDGIPFEVRHTPGHSPGGVALYQKDEQLVFVGDTLFAGSVGRHDFPTSDGAQLLESIRTQLLTLPDETEVLSGHGPNTTIGEERKHNPFF